MKVTVKREKQIFHTLEHLVHSPDGYNCRHLACSKPRGRGFIQVSHWCAWVVFHYFFRYSRKGSVGSRAPRTRIGVHMGCQHCMTLVKLPCLPKQGTSIFSMSACNCLLIGTCLERSYKFFPGPGLM